MKTANTPRWSCRIVRSWHSVAGAEGRPVSGFSGRHVRECADCRRFFATADALEACLRKEAPHRVQTPPFGMDQRILRAVAASQRPATRRRTTSVPFLFAGATAALVVAFTVLQTGPFNNGSRPVPMVETNSATSDSRIAGTATLELSQLTVPVETVLSTHSLDAEVTSVYTDARSAVRFLAANFLPDSNIDQTGG